LIKLDPGTRIQMESCDACVLKGTRFPQTALMCVLYRECFNFLIIDVQIKGSNALLLASLE